MLSGNSLEVANEMKLSMDRWKESHIQASLQDQPEAESTNPNFWMVAKNATYSSEEDFFTDLGLWRSYSYRNDGIFSEPYEEAGKHRFFFHADHVYVYGNESPAHTDLCGTFTSRIVDAVNRNASPDSRSELKASAGSLSLVWNTLGCHVVFRKQSDGDVFCRQKFMGNHENSLLVIEAASGKRGNYIYYEAATWLSEANDVSYVLVVIMKQRAGKLRLTISLLRRTREPDRKLMNELEAIYCENGEWPFSTNDLGDADVYGFKRYCHKTASSVNDSTAESLADSLGVDVVFHRKIWEDDDYSDVAFDIEHALLFAGTNTTAADYTCAVTRVKLAQQIEDSFLAFRRFYRNDLSKLLIDCDQVPIDQQAGGDDGKGKGRASK